MSAEEKLRFKFNKKLKIAVGNSKFSNSGRKKAEDNVNESENGKRENYKSSVRDKKFHTAEEGSRGVFDRRKRIYVDRDAAWEVNSNEEAPYRKVLSKKGQNQLKYGYVNEKNYSRSPSRPRYKWGSNESASETKRFSPKERSAKVYNNFGNEKINSRFPYRPRSKWDSDGLENASETKRFSPTVRSAKVYNETKVRDADNFGNEKSSSRSPSRPRSTWGSDITASETKRFSPKVRSEKRSNKTKVKDVDKMESITTDGGRSASLKKHNQIKPDLQKSPNISLPNTVEKKAWEKNISHEGSDVLDGQRKKKKRMRLDPYDISNKRLDDSIATNENLKEKEKDVEEKAEISKNAQFRAIQPSPSILSYVEDNLLGRRRLIELRRAGYNTELSAPLDNTPFSTSSERERIEENIFRSKLTFFAAAKVSSSFPPPDLPEIAFAGRSNVGKSSLLNALTRNWGVARTSDKPGLTQSINFFNLGSKLCLVDLPGYGFAYAKEEVKDAWEELVKEYVSTRVGLKRVCLLIDTKWGMKPRDRELIDLMERSQTKYQILLTKSDAVFPIDVARRAMQIEESLKANKSVVQPVMMMSSRTGAGIRSLRTVLAKIARVAKV
ncbi:uncharacterized protein LOC133732079 [Rosa rugosa]|uniref:uncharacterized protein LOC133732079 n=1 Tax=Rosa rugosa TaxID=74645 RepID=UPI002B4048F3|nr:uncharacterized protein LOC133732079 [Rosa rugosa]XP_062015525.1 uncharacterized protein LOC133732079 [Rosa rugosa]